MIITKKKKKKWNDLPYRINKNKNKRDKLKKK